MSIDGGAEFVPQSITPLVTESPKQEGLDLRRLTAIGLVAFGFLMAACGPQRVESVPTSQRPSIVTTVEARPIPTLIMGKNAPTPKAPSIPTVTPTKEVPKDTGIIIPQLNEKSPIIPGVIQELPKAPLPNISAIPSEPDGIHTSLQPRSFYKDSSILRTIPELQNIPDIKPEVLQKIRHSLVQMTVHLSKEEKPDGTIESRNAICQGTVVGKKFLNDGKEYNAILTAGHCVHFSNGVLTGPIDIKPLDSPSTPAQKVSSADKYDSAIVYAQVGPVSNLQKIDVTRDIRTLVPQNANERGKPVYVPIKSLNADAIEMKKAIVLGVVSIQIGEVSETSNPSKDYLVIVNPYGDNGENEIVQGNSGTCVFDENGRCAGTVAYDSLSKSTMEQLVNLLGYAPRNNIKIVYVALPDIVNNSGINN